MADSFSSAVYSLSNGDPDPDNVEIWMKARDMTFSVRIDDDHLRVLHLANVREDTRPEAQSAVDGFLDTIEPLGDGNRTGGTVYQMFDDVFEDVDTHVGSIMSDLEEFSSRMLEMSSDSDRYPKKPAVAAAERGLAFGDLRGHLGYDPCRELEEASDDFLRTLEAIRAKARSHIGDTCPSRRALVVESAEWCSEHGDISSYIVEQGQRRGLTFRLAKTSYPTWFRDGGTVPTYRARFDREEWWKEECERDTEDRRSHANDEEQAEQD